MINYVMNSTGASVALGVTDKVICTLTETGKSTYIEYLKSKATKEEAEKLSVDLIKGPVVLQLWEAMSIFGPRMHLNGDVLIGTMVVSIYEAPRTESTEEAQQAAPVEQPVETTAEEPVVEAEPVEAEVVAETKAEEPETKE